MISPLSAIHNKCIECTTDKPYDIINCTIINCPLWPFRNSDHPKCTTRFIKPTLEEVQAYCKERHNGIDAQRFLDFYEARGWMTGRTKIKDWKACVRTWERNNKSGGMTDAQRARPVESDEGLWDGLSEEQRHEYERIASDPDFR